MKNAQAKTRIRKILLVELYLEFITEFIRVIVSRSHLGRRNRRCDQSASDRLSVNRPSRLKDRQIYREREGCSQPRSCAALLRQSPDQREAGRRGRFA